MLVMKGAEKRGYTIDGWDTPKGGNLNTKIKERIAMA
jgi:hypothetical protein